ncbi:MAG: protein-tyrosine phosphatase family protein [Candidatus Endonucleobacter bathymodioli]|uniref:Protein-tyrosine phosphatase family protein n=1 Tax=Candidatus Endonucleibacter bathymodioli TaxID=539814 RepID=A0AA90NW46_9GAMM|nr:protein-tyrosine phosphatase family protein [Candidatus Endonucleobacter bathymodioli]
MIPPGIVGQNSIAELQTKFEKFQAKDSSSVAAKFGKTVKRWVQKKNYQSIKGQLVDALLKEEAVSTDVKDALIERKARYVPAKVIIRALGEILKSSSPQQYAVDKPGAKTGGKPSATVSALSLSEKVEKSSKEFQSKIEGHEWPEDILTSTSWNNFDMGDSWFKTNFKLLPNGGGIDKKDQEKADNGMFRRYGDFHRAGNKSAVTFKDKNFPHQLHANKVELLGQKFIAHEAIEAEDGTRKNGSDSFGSLLAMYSEQNVPVSVNLTEPFEGGSAKGYGIGSYVSKEDLKPGSEKIVRDIAGNNHTLKVLDMTTQTLNTNSKVTIETVKVSIDGKDHTHIYCKGWSDHGVLSAEVLVEISHMHHQLRGDSTGPTAIHCSAGVGKTGTFMAVDAVANAKDTSRLSTESLVAGIRTARHGAIQTEAQYKIVDTVVKHNGYIRSLLQSNTATSAGKVKEAASKPKTSRKPEIVSEEDPVYANTGAPIILTAKEFKEQMERDTYKNLQNGTVMYREQWRADLDMLSSLEISNLFLTERAPKRLKDIPEALKNDVYECHAKKRVGDFIDQAISNTDLIDDKSKADYVRDKIIYHPLIGNSAWMDSAVAELNNTWS